MGENTSLSGMKAIQTFCGSIGLKSSEVSVIDMIQNEEFPANKLGGIWESDKVLIIEWRRKRIAGNGNGKEPEPDKKQGKPAAAGKKGK